MTIKIEPEQTDLSSKKRTQELRRPSDPNLKEAREHIPLETNLNCSS